MFRWQMPSRMQLHNYRKSRSKSNQEITGNHPDQPQVIPLNLLAVPDFTGRAMPSCRSVGASGMTTGVRVCRRRYWDCFVSHMSGTSITRKQVLDSAYGFMAFNKPWRHKAMALLPPGERMGALALDALLGQIGEEDKRVRVGSRR